MKLAIWMFAFSAFVQCHCYANFPGKINFEQGLSWSQVKAKASAENKYIFIDCYATWCGPCKKMDSLVFMDNHVAEFINEHFISVRVQFDTATGDREEVRKWYGDAHAIVVEYSIKAFPSFLFLSPNGKLVHQGIGYQPVANFQAILHQALEPESQCYTLLEKFYSHTLSEKQMPSLADKLSGIGRRREAMDVARFYIDDYLLKDGRDSHISRSDLFFIVYHIQNTKDSSFWWVFQHSSRIDSLIGNHFAERILDRLISAEEITTAFDRWAREQRKVRNRDWLSIRDNIRRNYNADYADRIVLDGQIAWYSKENMWDEAIRYNVKKIEKYGLDTAGSRSVYTNNMLYSDLFMHCTDKRILSKAAEWAKIICEGHPDDGVYLDTYANLLYKKGDTLAAIALEEKAFKLAPTEKEIEAGLNKMKKGEPTWTAQ